MAWGFKVAHARSWGNGIIRISLKDLITVIAACCVAYGAWRDLKTSGNNNMEATNRNIAETKELRAEVAEVKGRVLVLETVAKMTQAKVAHISRAPALGPRVKVVKTEK